jgi:hypothetical protein
MRLWPDKKQWQRWARPTKIAVIVGMISAIASGIYIIDKVYQISRHLGHSRISEIEHNVGERGIILMEIGYSLYAYGLGAGLASGEFDSDVARREISELYARLGLSKPKCEFGAGMFRATRSALVSERDRQFLDIGLYLGATYEIGLVMILHRGTNYEIQGNEEMQNQARELRTALGSLGLLPAIESERRVDSYLMPASNDTVEAYEQTLGTLKAAIVGEIRRQYGGGGPGVRPGAASDM